MYVELNPMVGDGFAMKGDDTWGLGIIQILGELLDQVTRVTLYAGDSDYECNWLGVQAVAHAVNAIGFEEAGFVDVTTDDGVVHGQVKQAGGFSFVRVYQAGHAVGAFSLEDLAGAVVFGDSGH